MTKEMWRDLLLPPANEDEIWELFHENSKLGRYDRLPSEEDIRERMTELHESLPFEGYPIVRLPDALTHLNLSLTEAILARSSARHMSPCRLALREVATMLFYAYGVTRDNTGTSYPRPFRVVPSAGALYPLEIFLHSAHVDALKPGLYHYNPSKKHLRLLQEGDKTLVISDAMVQKEMGLSAALIILLTAVFERSVFKYGDRGYRFILMEAGHVAQNIDLVATALGLGSVNIGGFFDREIDDFLDLDGITHSAIYMIAIGAKADQTRTIDE